jgi:hypothetical protein
MLGIRQVINKYIQNTNKQAEQLALGPMASHLTCLDLLPHCNHHVVLLPTPLCAVGHPCDLGSPASLPQSLASHLSNWPNLLQLG